MVSSGGCTVNNDIVYECDGTRRPLTEDEKEDIRQWNVDFQEHMRKQFPPGFPFVRGEPSDPPQMRSPCKTCSNGGGINNYNINSSPFSRVFRHVQ
uniref:Pepsin-I3 domain-containing protein n=2 Tax=Bursaphelenchus xylophilus TaxID=6326 RepID=A0A1I7S8N8_BURXY